MSTANRMHALAVYALLALPGVVYAVDAGAQVQSAELPTLAGGKERAFAPGAAANVLVFVKPNHPRCVEALRELGTREGMHKGVHWLAVLPGDTSVAEARAFAAASGVKMPFAIDLGDRLYASLHIALHPTLVVLDRGGKVTGSVPYRAVEYGDRVSAHIRFTLGEITQAQVAAVEDPGKTQEPTEDQAARRHEQFGARLLEQGQFALALTQVNKALAISPSASAYCLQGKILGRLGRSGESTRALDVAVRLDPTFRQALAENVPCPLVRDRPQ